MEENVRVLFFASARKAAGCAENVLACEEPGVSEADFWSQLVGIYPALEPLRLSTRLAKNHEYLTAGELIKPGDEIALIPPVSGG
jgi:molybdopterin converting factor small subunit